MVLDQVVVVEDPVVVVEDSVAVEVAVPVDSEAVALEVIKVMMEDLVVSAEVLEALVVEVSCVLSYKVWASEIYNYLLFF